MGRKEHPYRIKEQDGFWYYKLRGETVFHSTGIRIENPKTTRREAERFCEKLQAIAPESRGFDTFGQYADRYFNDDSCPWYQERTAAAGSVTLKSRAQHRARLDQHILPQFSGHRFDELFPTSIGRWIYSLDYSSQWKKHIFNTFKIVLRDLWRDKLINFSPADITPPTVFNSVTATISDDATEAIFPVSVKRFRELWGRGYPLGVFLALLYSTGLRNSEARALTWAAVGWEYCGLKIVQTVNSDGKLSVPKGKSPRVVPLPRYSLALLKSLKKKKRSDFVFPGRVHGEPLAVGAPAHALRRMIKKLGIDCSVTPHGLRHTYNTRMREILSTAGLEDYFSDEYGFMSTTAEVDRLLRSFTGHKTEVMTELYDHPKLTNRLKFLNDNFREYVERIWG